MPKLIDNDETFFKDHPGRQVRIRSALGDESSSEFSSLGSHERSRRRIIAWKVPKDVRAPFNIWAGRVLKIPFLVVFDEEIRDDDETLLPMLNDLMIDAAKSQGITIPEEKKWH